MVEYIYIPLCLAPFLVSLIYIFLWMEFSKTQNVSSVMMMLLFEISVPIDFTNVHIRIARIYALPEIQNSSGFSTLDSWRRVGILWLRLHGKFMIIAVYSTWFDFQNGIYCVRWSGICLNMKHEISIW